jgi:hypothetical protein
MWLLDPALWMLMEMSPVPLGISIEISAELASPFEAR